MDTNPPVIYNDLYLNIFQFLLPHDLSRVSLVNRNFASICRDETLWRAMLIYRYGSNALDHLEPTASFREEYKRRSSPVVTAENLDITWLTPEHDYWRLEDNEESTSGKVAVLRAVCWFNVSAMLRSVPLGEYKVIWRLRGPGDPSLNDLEFRASSQTQDAAVEGMQATTTTHSSISILPGRRWVRSLSGQGWTEYELPDLLEVGTEDRSVEFMDVKLEIVDQSSPWKSGIQLDSVRLKRVEPERYEGEEEEEENQGAKTFEDRCTIN